MNDTYHAFGEILWDCLPTGRHPGGAPFNVAVHLAQLGVYPALLSSVGSDADGDELLRLAGERNVDVRFVTRARRGLETGRVNASLDPAGNATYDIVQPAAWDEIHMSPDARALVAAGAALIFGSLATRSPGNLEQLDNLLALNGPLKFFDVNMRPPYVDPSRIMRLAERADVLKLNQDELGQLAAWLRGADVKAAGLEDTDQLREACGVVAEATKAPRICVTLGAAGAALWERGELLTVTSPAVAVADTVGAGDAFMAGLVVGLTRGWNGRAVLERACRLGAYVASREGATPRLPPALVAEFAVATSGDSEPPAPGCLSRSSDSAGRFASRSADPDRPLAG